MSENTLEQAAADILTSALETVGSAKDFVLAELPDVVQQLLLWKMTESLIACAFGVAFLICFAACVRFALRMPSKEWVVVRRSWGNDISGQGIAAIIVLIFTSITSITAGLLLVNITWLQILIAPKVYLIEYAAKMVG